MGASGLDGCTGPQVGQHGHLSARRHIGGAGPWRTGGRSPVVAAGVSYEFGRVTRLSSRRRKEPFLLQVLHQGADSAGHPHLVGDVGGPPRGGDPVEHHRHGETDHAE